MGFKPRDVAVALSLMGAEEEVTGQVIASYSHIHVWGDEGDETSGTEFLQAAGVLKLDGLRPHVFPAPKF